jgi:hypothetical protein
VGTHMADTDYSPDASQGAPRKPFLARLIGVIVEPGETFQDIARKPDFWAPLILLVLVSVAVVETMLEKVGMEQIIMQTLKSSGQANRMDPAQLSEAIERGARVGSVLMQASAVVGVPFFLLVVAGFGILVLNGLFGQHASFKQAFSATCYACMPRVVGAVMAVAVIFFGDVSSFNPQSPAPTDVGFFLDPLTTSHVVSVLASSADIITLWVLVLLAIGLSRVAQNKVKTSSIFMTCFGAWILLVIVKVGFAMLTSSV